MTDIILFGMQGAGKGTQARILADKEHLVIFETGAELRRLIAEESPLGQKIKAIVERGDLVPNEVVMDIVSNFLDHLAPDQAALFDGLPRSMAQKQTFDRLLSERGRKIRGVFIDIPKDQALMRLLKRARNDDNELAIARRIENYENETLPVIESYERDGILRRIDGIGEVSEIAGRIEEALS